MGARQDNNEGRDSKPWVLSSKSCSGAQGYLNNPNATANAITPDGWFKTGDIVVRDKDAFFYVVDRKKELIKYKVRCAHKGGHSLTRTIYTGITRFG